MKQCLKCKETKPLSLFFKRKAAKDGYHYYCKSCANIACKQVRTADQWVVKWREIRKKRRERLNEIKRQFVCLVCKESAVECLDFHHLDGTTREASVSNLVYSSLESILEEIDKCVVLCSNCHRKHHAGNLALPL